MNALAESVATHGLHGLQVHPAGVLNDARIRAATRSFIGVTLVDSALDYKPGEPLVPPVRSSPEIRECQRRFRELLERAAVLAGISSNLYRLIADYRRTQRRARALEDVILPEIEATLHQMEEQLEEIDQEEAIRTHRRS